MIWMGIVIMDKRDSPESTGRFETNRDRAARKAERLERNAGSIGRLRDSPPGATEGPNRALCHRLLQLFVTAAVVLTFLEQLPVLRTSASKRTRTFARRLLAALPSMENAVAANAEHPTDAPAFSRLLNALLGSRGRGEAAKRSRRTRFGLILHEMLRSLVDIALNPETLQRAAALCTFKRVAKLLHDVGVSHGEAKEVVLKLFSFNPDGTTTLSPWAEERLSFAAREFAADIRKRYLGRPRLDFDSTIIMLVAANSILQAWGLGYVANSR